MAEQQPQPHDFRKVGLPSAEVSMLLKVPMHTRPTLYTHWTGDDGDGCPVRCAAPGCGAVIPLCLSHAGRIEHNYTTGVTGIGRCVHELADSGQHFGCCLDHLRAALIACWDEHTTPKLQAALNPAPPIVVDEGRFPARDETPAPAPIRPTPPRPRI